MANFGQFKKLLLGLLLLGLSFLDGCFLEAASWMAAFAFSFCKTPLGETGCLGNPDFLLTGYLSIQFFYSPLFFQHSQSGHLQQPTPHCAAPVLLTGCHAMPEVSSTSHPPFTTRVMDLRQLLNSQAFLYLVLLPAAFKVSLLIPTVHRQRQQGFMLIFKTQSRPDYCF